MTEIGEAHRTVRAHIDEHGVAVCTFSRPEVRNALNLAMVEDLRAVLDDLGLRRDLRVVIFTGAGDKAFVGGADIGELRGRDRYDALRFINNGLFRQIEQLQVPTIAAINGFALGGGCELALACDIRIGATGAKLGQPEVALGIIPGAGATYRLARVVGPGKARELVFTGRIVDADEAERMGLLNRVVPARELMEEAHEMARAIVSQSALAVRFAKLTMNAAHEMSVDACMTLEATAQAVLFDDADKHARMTAFLERKMGGPKKGERG